MDRYFSILNYFDQSACLCARIDTDKIKNHYLPFVFGNSVPRHFFLFGGFISESEKKIEVYLFML